MTPRPLSGRATRPSPEETVFVSENASTPHETPLGGLDQTDCSDDSLDALGLVPSWFHATGERPWPDIT